MPIVGLMDVRFTRTGRRQYGIAIRRDGAWGPTRPGPGFDEYLPHDIVHFVVEAELGLTLGVFGRQAAGGGQFPVADPSAIRRQARRQRRLKATGHGDMARSETFTAACTVLWKLRHGLIQEPPDWLRGRAMPDAARSAGPIEDAQVERVLTRLDAVAETWRGLEIGESMDLTWPHRPGPASGARPRSARNPAPRRPGPSNHRRG